MSSWLRIQAARERRFVTILLSVLFALPGASSLSLASPDTPLARLSFWLPPSRMAEFDEVYRKKVAPLLRRHGLRESRMSLRPSPAYIYSRLFESSTPSAAIERWRAVTADPAWRELEHRLRTAFPEWKEGTPLAIQFTSYTSPSRPGRAIPAGSGRGHWRTYGVIDGLAGTEVQSILQDRKGDLWIGTNGSGVSRYDGRTWTTFTTRDGLAGNCVLHILQDVTGNLWFSSWGGGVSRYDGRGWTTFTARDGLAGNWATGACQDQQGNLWFGSWWGEGVSRFDGRVWKTFTARDGLADGNVCALLHDREGNLWFGTRDAGVSRYDSKIWTTYTEKNGLAGNIVTDIMQDQDGSMWFGTWDGGASRFNGRTWQTFSTKDGLAGNSLSAIIQDRDGDLWFGTGRRWVEKGRGASRFDGHRWTTITTRDGLAGNTVNTIHQDREGSLWFGTEMGLSRYEEGTFATFSRADGLASHSVMSAFRDRDGNLWFGTEDAGVSKYSGDTWTTYSSADGLLSDKVLSIAQDRDGSLWFGTDKGASRYDGRSWANYTGADGLASGWVWALFPDRTEGLWFGTWVGASRYDGRSIVSFMGEPGQSSNRIISGCRDRAGNVWLGTEGGGVCRFDGTKWTSFSTQDGLPSSTVRACFLDREGNLWLGAEGGGACRFDGKKWTTFSTRDGLPSNTVYAVFQDRDGHIWFGTEGGACRYDGKVFQILTNRDGLGGNRVRSILQDLKGDLWFATQDGGVTRYRLRPATPPAISIDAVVADRRHESATELTIPSSVDVTAFEFHAASFKTRPESMVYRYRLSGYDRDWSSTRQRRVEYQNLPRGVYTFEVQAVDRDLAYSPAPAVVRLRVHIPYDRIGLSIALGVALVLVTWQTARILRRDRRLHQTNESLRAEIAERERLDAQLRRLRYLYRLRAVLSSARSEKEVIQRAGEALMEALTSLGPTGVRIECGNRIWRFGTCTACELANEECASGIRRPLEKRGDADPETTFRNPQSRVRYRRALAWGERSRGCLRICRELPLSESQERELLDETAAQVSQALEAREMELQLLQSARLVSLGEMAAGLAHELNQPLSAISATAGDIALRLIEGPELPRSKLRDMVQDMLNLVERMARTIDHMRIFSRDSSRESGVEFSINEAIRDSLRLIETQLKNHKIAVELDLADDLAPVSGHPRQMEQVFLNLFANARDAVNEKESDGGGDESRIAFHEPRGWEKEIWVRTRQEGNRVVAEVEDNGPGIPEAILGRIFEPFFTTKEADRGTGLGLTLSYSIVRNHKGEITCESAPGRGTTIRVSLPVSDPIAGVREDDS